MENIKISTIVENKVHTSELTIKSDKTDYTFNKLSVNISFQSPINSLRLSNNSSTSITVSKLEILAASLNIQGYSKYLINAEFPTEDIIMKNTKQIKGESLSFLYTFLQGVDDFQSLIVGFLSSHISRNYIKIVKKDNTLKIYAVYDFVNHVLPPHAAFNLDCFYMEFNRNYSKLLNNYSQSITNKFPSAINSFRKLRGSGSISIPDTKDTLYSSRVTQNGLHVDNKPVSINIKGKKLFLLDVSKPETKEEILRTCSDLARNNSGTIYLKNLMPYLNETIRLRPFNPYFEISNLLNYIKANIEGVVLIFEDCPEGIALNTLDILSKEINMKSRINLFSKLIAKQNSHVVDYNFVINTIIQRNLFTNSTHFNIDNEKIKHTMEVMSLSMNLPTNNKQLNNIADDIDPHQQIMINLQNEGLFSILRFGANSLYIAVFNLSSSSKRFYWDFSSHTKQGISGGVATDIYTNSSYLISDGKIHIRKIPPWDCCLIVKPLNRTATAEAE